MSQLADAIAYMATQKMSDLFVWHTELSKDGRSGWKASCKLDNGLSCYVSRDLVADPVTAMLDALTQAWEGAASKKEPAS